MSRRNRAKNKPLPQLAPVSSSNATAKSGCGSIRPSTRGRWRALSLFLVHVAMALHIALWMINGKTLTPVEPSEAMQTLGSEALVNAGFVLFGLTIVSTFIFGRFFCGWGCHVIAYQDMCTWFLKKIGIRPQPFRSRLLIFVPLAAGLFMFVMPALVRLVLGRTRAPYTAHFMTYDFWDRFPGWLVGSLTLGVCGFAIVYLLGNKGFCSYACPYGGFFGVADQFAPGKIRVTDACEQCGHCTATCSSNVRVHEEVHTYGMVVNPGCMKCLDCVSVCPKDALYFGFGNPSVAGKKRRPAKPKRYDYTWPEEIALVVIFLVSVAILRKLYDGVPLLLALALASISAYAGLSAARMTTSSRLRFARFQLKANGKVTTTGRLFVAIVTLWGGFLAHSALVQFHTLRGRTALDASIVSHASQEDPSGQLTRMHLDQAIASLEKADAFGLVPVANLLYDLSRAYISAGETEKAKRCLERAIDFSPGFAAGHYELAGILTRAGDAAGSEAMLREVVRLSPEFPSAHSDLANLLIASGRSSEAVALLGDLTQERPDIVAFQLTKGLALAHDGAYERAIEVMRQTVARWPSHPDAHFNLGVTLASHNDDQPALEALRQAARLNPDSGLIHYTLAQLAHRSGHQSLVDTHLLAAINAEPFNPEYVRSWVHSVHDRDALEKEIALAERAATLNQAARYRLVYLYGAAGRTEEARRLAVEFSSDDE